MESYIKEIEKLTKVLGNEQHLASYIDLISDGYYEWHFETNYVYVSPKFLQTLGCTEEDGNTNIEDWGKMVFPEDLKKAETILKEHIESKGKVPYSLQCRYTHKKGHTVTIFCRGEVIEWAGSVPIRMIGTHTDISNLK